MFRVTFLLRMPLLFISLFCAAALALLNLPTFCLASLVLPGHRLELISDDSSEFTGQGVGPYRGGNQGYSTRRYYDDCSHAFGIKYDERNGGATVINDCFVTVCSRWRGSSTSSASYGGGSYGSGQASQTSGGEYGGSTKVYKLVQAAGEIITLGWDGGLDDAFDYPCQCSGHITMLNTGESTCFVGGKWAAVDNYDENSCAYRTYGTSPRAIGCGSGGGSLSAAGKAAVTIVVLVLIVGVLWWSNRRFGLCKRFCGRDYFENWHCNWKNKSVSEALGLEVSKGAAETSKAASRDTAIELESPRKAKQESGAPENGRKSILQTVMESLYTKDPEPMEPKVCDTNPSSSMNETNKKGIEESTERGHYLGAFDSFLDTLSSRLCGSSEGDLIDAK